ncbi:assimilatory nitrate reductase catalytic subunit [Constrictibacter sp. MBR-5]|uniref:nitrate reductase n=1 Tax=Constrictibacter sp. MBR-5 TaxID=3156467 RepID=UPI0033945068
MKAWPSAPELGGTVRTTCPYCGVGCGVLATPRADGGVDIAGNPDHPANRGRLCSKGAALGETLSLDDRLTVPEVDGRPATWDAALGLVAERFAAAVAKHGPDSVAFYVSGQLLTEDYYVANKLMKGFIGSANIDTNSRLCMASSVAGHVRAFGSDTVPGTYADLDEADLVVLVGSNLAWCHPVLFQRLLAARERRGTRIVVLDPRVTNTAEEADLHLALAPDSDVALFLGLLDHLAAGGFADHGFVDAHTAGLDDAVVVAAACGLEGAARATGLSAADLSRFFSLWAGAERVVTVYSQGVNQSVSGTDKVNAIINCHLLTGRIGKPGAGPFSVTGQPNAMGGREVGGLANMLAAHMRLDDPAHREIVQGFWASPRIAERPGLKAVDLFRAVGDGRIKALWIMATNPAVSLPDADAVAAALAACPFVVVSDVTRTDTTYHAHVLLPAAAWAEKDGTVTNSERRISRQRGFLPLPGETRADWRIVCDVAARMGWADDFAFDGPAAIFREHAALSAAGNGGARDFDIGGCTGLDDRAYGELAPFQWPLRASEELGEPPGERRFFADGRFYTDDGRARFVATPVRAAVEQPDETFPLILNTGRIRDQWHTMTRTAKSPRLMRHIAEPFCEIHTLDAAAAGIAPATLIQLDSARGGVIVRALVTDRQRRGSVFVPMHWTNQLAASGRIGAATAAHTDPVSGQPGLKFGAAAVRPFPAAWYGFAVLRDRPQRIDAPYRALAGVEDGWRLEFAGVAVPEDWDGLAAALLGVGETLSVRDESAGRLRFARFDGDRLAGAIFLDRQPVAAARVWLAERLGVSFGDTGERLRILSGRPGTGQADAGPAVCACLGVGANRIDAAIAAGAATAEAVGAATGAGTNCGSCRTDLRRMIHARRMQEAV